MGITRERMIEVLENYDPENIDELNEALDKAVAELKSYSKILEDVQVIKVACEAIERRLREDRRLKILDIG